MVDVPNSVAAMWAALDAAIADTAPVDLAWIQPPPTNSGWTLAPDALRLLARLTPRLRPRHVVEFGAGLSTRVLARSAANLDSPCAISSVDHDPEFGAPTAERPGDLPATISLRFQLAPVVARDCGGKLLPAYHLDRSRFASPLPADLVLIDGPPITLGGREGTLYQAMEFIRPGTLLLLDDADRRSERSAVAHWLDNLGDAIETRYLPHFAKGLCAIVVREPIPRSALWQRKLNLTFAQIEQVVGAGKSFVLIDQDYWPGNWSAGRRALPMLGAPEDYAGPPVDDAAAIAAVEKHRAAGVAAIALLWPAFWWLDYYAGLMHHLRQTWTVRCENDRLLMFTAN
jgi:hypothetical protein